ncbi:MAG: YiiX/YebB-like N1pC/P60 family cysteine hydrolase [Pseudomonadota bacterium]
MLPQTGCAAFDRDFAAIFKIATRQAGTAEELEKMLEELYEAIFNVDLKAYDSAELQAEATLVMRATFDLHIKLRQRLADWEKRGLVSKEAESRLRAVFRAMRYAADMLGELTIGYDQMDPGEKPYRAFTGPHNNTFILPGYAAEDGQAVTFQSGDVIVVRGLIHNSAAIARIGDLDSQFSHVAMIHVDGKGRHRVLEALMEEGATISSLDYTLEHRLARAVLYRHRDCDVAARAADRMYERIKASRAFSGKHIFYDFTMELDNYKDLFCSKVIREGFDRASGGLIMLPTHPTEFRLAPEDFIKRIGVTAEESFAPGDMELETQFTMVAEWRDFRKTSRVRLMDLVMVKLFEWMDRGYVFKPTFSIRMLSSAAKASGYLPNILKNMLAFAVPKIPSNMSMNAIEAIAMLHETAEPIYQALHAAELKAIKETGRPMHPRDVYAYLDAFEKEAGGQIGYLRKT